jgi:hypothetical protein
MDIFVVIKHDSKTQLGDKVRFDLSNIFVARPFSPNNISKIEFKPTPSSSFYVVHDSAIPAQKFLPKDWYFDWSFESKTGAVANVMDVEVRVTADDATVQTKLSNILLFTKAEDALFSDDNDLLNYEHDILKYLPAGRSSWNHIHRRSQERILSYLFEKGFKNSDGTPFGKDQLVDKQDYKEWSTFMTLKLIFGTAINSKDDVFVEKSRFYENLEAKANKTEFRIDTDKDGISNGTISLSGPLLVRR